MPSQVAWKQSSTANWLLIPSRKSAHGLRSVIVPRSYSTQRCRGGAGRSVGIWIVATGFRFGVLHEIDVEKQLPQISPYVHHICTLTT